MRRLAASIAKLLLFIASLLCVCGDARSQEDLRFSQILRQTNAEIALRFIAPKGTPYRLETSRDLGQWDALLTGLSAGTNQHVDGATPFLQQQFYRAVPVAGTNIITGDHLTTTKGDVVIHPINHASLVMSWNGLMIYNDPVGGSAPYRGLPRADLILISHAHGDHFETATLNAVKTTNTILIAPPAVYSTMPSALRAQTIPLANNTNTNVLGLTVEAVPAYNSNHPRGAGNAGNGYVITLGGRRIYFSGDTEDIPEMRALLDIDVAFVAMNVPFTMSVTRAASAIRQFRPRIIYPYHFRNSDSTLANFQTLRQQLGTDLGIELRLRVWY